MSKMINDRLRQAMKALAKPTAESMARAAFAELKKIAVECGMRESEVGIWEPGKPRYFNDTSCWTVAFEAGPHDWAVSATLSDVFPKLVEPYYGFDLCFYPSED